MVECDLAKVEVAGSNPVSRSKIDNGPPFGRACTLRYAGTSSPAPLRVLLSRKTARRLGRGCTFRYVGAHAHLRSACC